LPELEDIDTEEIPYEVDVSNNIMAALSSVENEVYKV
jgi:hypothetical protein